MLANAKHDDWAIFLFFHCDFFFLLDLFSAESSKEQFASTNIAEELVRLFRKQVEHEKKEMIFEVLAPLAENGKNEMLH